MKLFITIVTIFSCLLGCTENAPIEDPEKAYWSYENAARNEDWESYKRYLPENLVTSLERKWKSNPDLFNKEKKFLFLSALNYFENIQTENLQISKKKATLTLSGTGISGSDIGKKIVWKVEMIQEKNSWKISDVSVLE
ncbi:MAG: hypothetical protein ING30_10570 [Burkholderiales bacterium]|jgi:hypothetical protein|uniref:hypothetical protein n=1 Tax=unclassified Microcystis TaxID=2643300 RepID=UPI0025828F12|nr:MULTISPECIES: hypothetical protein [unclassified Microcystis]MCA2933725.1 hypothetical protein [Microcystis sp. M015S1]MCA3155451.1 hypothetical protein [Burkholderiales bacterium]MCA2860677.1 hypothetical protein [Microcystis sp. M005S1]MCA2919527.1 hypothetical protein [Microcystis sp. M017S1]MCA3173443.1 hypothetical protein [Burkholderiales bacterium]